MGVGGEEVEFQEWRVEKKKTQAMQIWRDLRMESRYDGLIEGWRDGVAKNSGG